MKTYRCVPEKELIEILEGYNKYLALQSGGVDNWSWYSESLYDYLNNWIAKYPHIDPASDWDFRDIAEDDLNNYPSVDF